MADRRLDYVITAEYEGKRILDYLTAKGYSRALQTFLKRDEDCVILNGEAVYLNHCLREGDILKIWIKEIQSSEKIPPVKLDVDIIYEDEDIVVVNKPADMPIHPSLNNYENTLGNAMAHRYLNRGEQFVYRCINRLDKDTTGLTVIAKNMLSACILYDQMINRRIRRSYYAICQGSLPTKCGIIDMPIGRKPGSTIERRVDYDNGERAVTHYELLAKGPDLSFYKLWLETGRTHQIRVHMSANGCPLIGDFLYNSSNTLMDRQALHAGELSLYHPVTGEQMQFTSSLPEDMQKIVAAFL